MSLFLKKYTTQSLLLMCCLFVLSCTGPKRATIKKEITAAHATHKNEVEKLAATTENNKLKFAEEKIDSAINQKINLKLNTYKNQSDSLGIAINFIDSVIKKGKLFKQNKNNIEQQLILVRNYSSNSNSRLRRFKMIDDGLAIAEQHKFNLAAFFGLGKYEISPDKVAEAEQSFAPILDSLANFSNNYADVEQMATLVVLGYADAAGFEEQSEIYKTLTTLLNDSVPTRQSLNFKLSELRAQNITDLMEQMLNKKKADKAVQNIDFIFIQNGKGESLPSKKITDYTEVDERRRVVMLFWNILPK